MRIILSNDITIFGMPEEVKKYVRYDLTIMNPKYVEAERMGRYKRNIPETLEFFIENKNSISVPRGYFDNLNSLCQNQKLNIIDKRNSLPEINFKFHGKNIDYQDKAVSEIIKYDNATLEAPTGSGKTVMALRIIVERKQPTLIVVHTKELLYQWCDRISTFLKINKKDIGLIGDQNKKISKKINVAMVKTLSKMTEKVKPFIGHLIFDECHRVPSSTFQDIAIEFNSKYVLGLSATPFRRDGLTKLIHWFVGPIRHKIEIEKMRDKGAISEVEVIFNRTCFKTMFEPSFEYSKMIKELTEDQERNSLIIDNVISEYDNGISLIVSDRTKHCMELKRILKEKGYDAELLIGSTNTTERKKVVENINNNKSKIIIATGQLIGEGFDSKNLQNMFIATPIRFNGRLLQYIGRILRPSENKEKAKLYDYIDDRVTVLVASAKARAKIYRQHFDYEGKF